jgi:hypothetical protein
MEGVLPLLAIHRRQPACRSMLLGVFGLRSSLGWPATVTVPDLTACRY